MNVVYMSENKEYAINARILEWNSYDYCGKAICPDGESITIFEHRNGNQESYLVMSRRDREKIMAKTKQEKWRGR
jgi:hypothetical protein